MITVEGVIGCAVLVISVIAVAVWLGLKMRRSYLSGVGVSEPATDKQDEWEKQFDGLTIAELFDPLKRLDDDDWNEIKAIPLTEFAVLRPVRMPS